MPKSCLAGGGKILVLFLSFFPAFPTYHFTFAGLCPLGRNFKVGGKIVRPVWKERFPKGSAPVPHHPPIQTALSNSPQSGWVFTSNRRPLGQFRPQLSTFCSQKRKKRFLRWYSLPHSKLLHQNYFSCWSCSPKLYGQQSLLARDNSTA